MEALNDGKPRKVKNCKVLSRRGAAKPRATALRCRARGHIARIDADEGR